MARYRRTRKYTRYGRRTKWSSNIQEISSDVSNGNEGYNIRTHVLAYNPIQTNTATSQTYTVKNFDVSFIFEAKNTQYVSRIENICAYIMFVPQGMNVTANYNIEHPEYIMATKFIGSPASDFAGLQNFDLAMGQNYQPHRIRTRLSRTLNTGDSIQLFIKFTLPADVTGTYAEYHGLAKWWTKAN